MEDRAGWYLGIIVILQYCNEMIPITTISILLRFSPMINVCGSSFEARRLFYQNKNHVIATIGDKNLVLAGPKLLQNIEIL